MARLPTPGSDDGKWGQILNDYLSQSHNADGTIKAGAVSKSDVGLGSVDNTADANKPISTATQTALNTKLATADLDSQTAAKIADGASATSSALTARTVDLIGMSEVTPPAGFSLTAPVPYTIYRTVLGMYLLDIDVDALRPAAGVTYYIAPSGASGNTGLTESSPLRLQDALGKSDVGTIICLPGEYYWNTHQPGKITKSLNIIGRSGAVLTSFRQPSTVAWTLHSGNIYKTSKTLSSAIVDKRDSYKDANGDYPMYLQMSTLGDVTSSGCWFTDGTDVYVWPLGNADLSVDGSFMRINVDTGNSVLNLEGANTLYIEGLQVEGGGSPSPARGAINCTVPSSTGARPRLICVDTTVKYGSRGFRGNSAELALFIRCRSTTTGGDGFTYSTAIRSSVPVPCSAIEVDCVALNNGQSTNSSQNDNGSTSHGGTKVIRINGTYRNSYGPCVDEDGPGTASWNLNLTAGGSRSPSRYWTYCASSNGAEMWLEDCAADPGKTALHSYDATAKVHLRRPRTGSVMQMSKTSTATVDSY